jgi:hypothetical protein
MAHAAAHELSQSPKVLPQALSKHAFALPPSLQQFHSKSGKAYLFTGAANIVVGPPVSAASSSETDSRSSLQLVCLGVAAVDFTKLMLLPLLCNCLQEDRQMTTGA